MPQSMYLVFSKRDPGTLFLAYRIAVHLPTVKALDETRLCSEHVHCVEGVKGLLAYLMARHSNL